MFRKPYPPHHAAVHARCWQVNVKLWMHGHLPVSTMDLKTVAGPPWEHAAMSLKYALHAGTFLSRHGKLCVLQIGIPRWMPVPEDVYVIDIVALGTQERAPSHTSQTCGFTCCTYTCPCMPAGVTTVHPTLVFSLNSQFCFHVSV